MCHASDRFEHTFGIFQDLPVLETKDADTSLLQILITHSIVRGSNGIGMRASVQLNGQSDLRAIEIHDNMLAETVLSSELQTVQLLVP